MANSKLEERDWRLLLGRIRDGKCTPVLGNGVHLQTSARYAQIAQSWADKHQFPALGAGSDLTSISVFGCLPGSNVSQRGTDQRIKSFALPDFSLPNEPLNVFASLPLPIYLTTDYTDFIIHALKFHNKDPKQEYCRWCDELQSQKSIFDSAAGYEPTVANPLVFHLHGHNKLAESLVLTEDNYLSFLVNISKDERLIPPRIQRAVATSSLILLGFNPRDWGLRVILQGLINSKRGPMNRISITVQLPPVSENPEDPRQQHLQNYFEDYYGGVGFKAYWGTPEEFATELRQRWREFSDAE